MTQSAITPTDGQRKQYLRFVEDAAERALEEVNPNKEGLQRLITNGGDFQDRIVAAVREFTLTNQFADEEVESRYMYPAGYRVKPLADQIVRLWELFPRFTKDAAPFRHQLPSIAEGRFAIPRWEKIAPTYNEAVEIVLAKIAEARPFYNYREGQLGAQHLRQSARSAAFWQKLNEQQRGHDILVVPAQFGLRHRGKSVRRVRALMEGTQEFGLGAYEVGMMLLTHPERITSYDDLWLDCPGDEYAPKADGSFMCAPFWRFDGDELKFGTFDVAFYYDHYGSASAVFPE